MSINNVIPALWSARMLQNLNNEHVYANCVNRDYEGEITGMGSSVKINSIGRVTIRTYARNTDLAATDTLQDAGQFLVIDQGKYFNFAIDDVDKAQANVNMMDAAMKEAAWGLADTVDLALGVLIAAGIPSTQTLTAATVGTGPGESDAYKVLTDMDVKLTEQNTPRGGRWVVVPPWYEGMLRNNVNFVGFGTSENRAVLTAGKPIGSAAGFNVYVSNNVPTSSSQPQIIAGYSGAITYAEQVTEQVAYRPEKRFGDAMKGLLVYGYKVTRPNNLAMIVATRGS